MPALPLVPFPVIPRIIDVSVKVTGAYDSVRDQV